MAPAVPLLPLWQRAQLALERRDRTPGTLKTRPQPIPFLCSFFQLPAPPPGVTAEVLQRQALAFQARLEVAPLRPEFLHRIREGPRALFPTAPPPAPGETLASVGLGRRGTGAEHGAALGRTERRSPGCPPRTGPATSPRRQAPPPLLRAAGKQTRGRTFRVAGRWRRSQPLPPPERRPGQSPTPRAKAAAGGATQTRRGAPGAGSASPPGPRLRPQSRIPPSRLPWPAAWPRPSPPLPPLNLSLRDRSERLRGGHAPQRTTRDLLPGRVRPRQPRGGCSRLGGRA